MPDYFVPLDTLSVSSYLNRLYYVNAVQEFAFEYASANEKKLEDMGFEAFKSNFRVTTAQENDLMDIGTTYKVDKKPAALAEARELFHIHMKAQIARRIWGNDGFYPIFNETNEILQNAVKVFDESEELDRSEF